MVSNLVKRIRQRLRVLNVTPLDTTQFESVTRRVRAGLTSW